MRRGLAEQDLNRGVPVSHCDPISKMGKFSVADSTRFDELQFSDCDANLLFEFKEQGLSANSQKKWTFTGEIESPLRRSRIQSEIIQISEVASEENYSEPACYFPRVANDKKSEMSRLLFPHVIEKAKVQFQSPYKNRNEEYTDY